MKVFISFDMEGVAGIVDWAQCRAPGQPHEEGRRLLLGEVNAAIDGARMGGATEFVCNDSQTATQLDQAYRRMAAEARYRPAAARGDDEALRFCAQNVTDPVEVIMALAQWFDGLASSVGHDTPALLEAFAEVDGLA